MAASEGGEAVSAVDAALLARLMAPGEFRLGFHRPRGEWIVTALHGRSTIPSAAPDEGGGAPPGEGDPPGAGGSPGVVASGSPPVLEATRARLLDEGAEWLDTALELERGLAQLAGARARALASFARCRPSAWDRQAGERGAASAATRAARPEALTEVSEWAVAEVAARLRVSSRAASGLLAESVELAERLPGTLAALETGDISWLHARALVELLRPVSAGKRELVEARVLPRAPRQTVAQLRECTKRAIARIDADAAVRRVVQAVRERKVTRSAGQDGMDVLSVTLPAPVARACQDALRAYAEACAHGPDGQPDPRGLDERMADCFADLVLRPDAEGRPPLRVTLSVVAGVGTLTGRGPDAEEPGEVDGETVPAALVRELAYTLGLLPRPAMPDSLEAGTSAGDAERGVAVGAGGAAPEQEAGSADADADAVAAVAALLEVRRLRGTALAEQPRIAVVDQLTGCLLALTDSTGLRAAVHGGTGVGPPEGTDAHDPPAALDRFVRLRDRRCRFPGCRTRIRRCDLDHRVPHPRGPTAHGNLEGLCEHHHRLSHQAPGWRLSGTSGGGLVWTLPGGTTLTTVPPRFGADTGSEPGSADGSGIGIGNGNGNGNGTGNGTGSGGVVRASRERVDWRRLTSAQRRVRVSALVRGRAAGPGEPVAPF